jgi:hypothetical protein
MDHHRDNGPAVIYKSGDRYWYKRGLYHREDGPAIEFADGSGHWYQNNRLHRLDGPAVDWIDRKEWYIDGLMYSEEEFLRIVKLKAFF